jgi:MFS transporter, AAHS family, 3-hydroxyphenylpropionic acid transporter
MNSTHSIVARRWWTIILLWLAGVSAAMQFAKMAVGFDAFQSDFATGQGTISALIAACGFFGLLFGVSGATITARFGFRRALLVSLGLAAILSLAQALTSSIPLLYATRLAEGATNLFIVVAAPVLIAREAPPRHAASAMALWGTFYGVAFGLAGAVGPWLIMQGGTQVLLVAHAAFTLATAALLLLRPLSDPPTVGGLPTLRHLMCDNLRTITQRVTALPGLIFLFHASIYLGLLIFIPLSAPDPWSRQLLLVGMPVLSIAGTLLAGPLADRRVPPEIALSAGFIGLMILAVSLTMMTGPLSFVAVAFAMVTVSGLVQGSIFSLPARLATDHGDVAAAFGLIAQLGSLGSIIGPSGFGTAAEAGGLSGVVLLICLFAIAGLLVTTLGFGMLKHRTARHERRQ